MRVLELVSGEGALDGARLLPSHGQLPGVVAVAGERLLLLPPAEPGLAGPPPRELAEGVDWFEVVRAADGSERVVWLELGESVRCAPVLPESRTGPPAEGFGLLASRNAGGPRITRDGTELVLCCYLDGEWKLHRHDLETGEGTTRASNPREAPARMLGLHAHRGETALLWTAGDYDGARLFLTRTDPEGFLTRTRELAREQGDHVFVLGAAFHGDGGRLLAVWVTKGREMSFEGVRSPDLGRSLESLVLVEKTNLRAHRAALVTGAGLSVAAANSTGPSGMYLLAAAEGEEFTPLEVPPGLPEKLGMSAPLHLTGEGEHLHLLRVERDHLIHMRWQGRTARPAVVGEPLEGGGPPEVLDLEALGDRLLVLVRVERDRLLLVDSG